MFPSFIINDISVSHFYHRESKKSPMLISIDNYFPAGLHPRPFFTNFG